MDRAPSMATAAVLRVGSLGSVFGFIVGLALAVARPEASHALVPLQVLPAQLVSLEPGAWLTAAAVLLIVTPAAGLLATATEFAGLDRRSMLLALALFVLLVTSVLLAIAL
jgi:hypothetical protein